MTLHPIGSEAGPYEVSFRDRNGNETHRATLTALQKFPVIGEALDVFGDGADERTSYVVRDVRHIEDDAFNSMRPTRLLVVLVPADNAEPPNPDSRTTTPGGASRRTHGGRGSSSRAEVVPFAPKALDTRSPLLPFWKLIAWVVAAGYREQKIYFESLKVSAWHLEWAGKRWVVSRLAHGLDAAGLRAVSRDAGRQEQVAFDFFMRSIALVASEAPIAYDNVIELRPRGVRAK